jgi:glutamine amidotransferase
MIAVVDYGAGNTGSVLNAIRHLGFSAILTHDAELLLRAEKVIFPGVGHAEKAMNQIVQKGLDRLIPKLTCPFLGICLGMQLLGKESEEGHVSTLGIMPYTTKAFTVALPIPHMGWNEVKDRNKREEKGHFYFVHGYYVPLGPWTQWEAQYQHSFSAAVAYRNFFGVQFHPEKSGDAGLQLLHTFLTTCNLFQP